MTPHYRPVEYVGGDWAVISSTGAVIVRFSPYAICYEGTNRYVRALPARDRAVEYAEWKNKTDPALLPVTSSSPRSDVALPTT